MLAISSRRWAAPWKRRAIGLGLAGLLAVGKVATLLILTYILVMVVERLAAGIRARLR
jgi:hypothetical protein